MGPDAFAGSNLNLLKTSGNAKPVSTDDVIEPNIDTDSTRAINGSP